MSIDLSRDPNYDAILEALLEKTKAGKITWSATSEPSTFVAAVKGTQTYRLCRQTPEATPRKFGTSGVERLIDAVVLTVLDENGKALYSIRRDSIAFPRTPTAAERVMAATTSGIFGQEVSEVTFVKTTAGKLFEVAQRLANRVDEKVDQTLELLNAL